MIFENGDFSNSCGRGKNGGFRIERMGTRARSREAESNCLRVCVQTCEYNLKTLRVYADIFSKIFGIV